MEIQEIVRLINSKEKQVKGLAEELGINPSTLQRRLKNEGYSYDKKTKQWIKDEAVHNASIVKASKSTPKANAFNEIAVTIESELDTIDMLLTRKATSKKRTYRGFYFDEEVLKVIDSIASGNKSDLVNEALRKVFKEKGLL